MRKTSRASSRKDPDSTRWAAIVLAAGRGTRMRSRLPKVLHPVCGRPMIQHVLNAVHQAGVPLGVVVVPPGSEAIRAAVGTNETRFATQDKPLGTGHAVRAAMPDLAPSGTNGKSRTVPEHILVLAGDVPLIRPQTLTALMQRHVDTGAEVTVLTAENLPTEGLGRIVRNGAGAIVRIVEERDVRYQQERIREVNAGLYCFRAEPLWARLAELTPSRSGELYLTQVIDLTLQSGGRVEGLPTNDPWDAFGINTRRQLAQASDVMRERLCDAWMERGVTIVDPRTTYLDATITLGQDTVLHPGTHLYGDTHVGADCALGPGAILRDTRVADGCVIGGSVLEGAVLEQGVTIGPFCHLRPGAHLKRNVHLGNYVEVKQSTLGEGTAAGHFSYIGDATVGKNVNIGAGAITCNYDGVQKNRTIIGDGAFIGCDTMLVAPVRVGRRAATGAGSVVTRDIPPDTLVVGVPAKPRPRTGKPGNSQG